MEYNMNKLNTLQNEFINNGGSITKIYQYGIYGLCPSCGEIGLMNDRDEETGELTHNRTCFKCQSNSVKTIKKVVACGGWDNHRILLGLDSEAEHNHFLFKLYKEKTPVMIMDKELRALEASNYFLPSKVKEDRIAVLKTIINGKEEARAAKNRMYEEVRQAERRTVRDNLKLWIERRYQHSNLEDIQDKAELATKLFSGLERPAVTYANVMVALYYSNIVISSNPITNAGILKNGIETRADQYLATNLSYTIAYDLALAVHKQTILRPYFKMDDLSTLLYEANLQTPTLDKLVTKLVWLHYELVTDSKFVPTILNHLKALYNGVLDSVHSKTYSELYKDELKQLVIDIDQLTTKSLSMLIKNIIEGAYYAKN